MTDQSGEVREVAPMNAAEIEEFENLAARSKGNEDMLRVALNLYANKASVLAVEMRAFWDSLADQYDLDMAQHGYTMERRRGTTYLLETDRPKTEHIGVLPAYH